MHESVESGSVGDGHSISPSNQKDRNEVFHFRTSGTRSTRARRRHRGDRRGEGHQTGTHFLNETSSGCFCDDDDAHEDEVRAVVASYPQFFAEPHFHVIKKFGLDIQFGSDEVENEFCVFVHHDRKAPIFFTLFGLVSAFSFLAAKYLAVPAFDKFDIFGILAIVAFAVSLAIQGFLFKVQQGILQNTDEILAADDLAAAAGNKEQDVLDDLFSDDEDVFGRKKKQRKKVFRSETSDQANRISEKALASRVNAEVAAVAVAATTSGGSRANAVASQHNAPLSSSGDDSLRPVNPLSVARGGERSPLAPGHAPLLTVNVDQCSTVMSAPSNTSRTNSAAAVGSLGNPLSITSRSGNNHPFGRLQALEVAIEVPYDPLTMPNNGDNEELHEDNVPEAPLPTAPPPVAPPQVSSAAFPSSSPLMSQKSREILRRNAQLHEMANSLVIVGIVCLSLFPYFRTDRCGSFAASGHDTDVMQRQCRQGIQYEGMILLIHVVWIGFAPIRFSGFVPLSLLSTIVFFTAVFFANVTQRISVAAHISINVAALVCMGVSWVRLYQVEHRQREDFIRICSLQAVTWKMTSIKEYATSLVGPAIPLEVATQVAARQELFDYCTEGAVMCVRMRDITVIASNASSAELVDFLQRMFLVLDTIKSSFPRCFKLHALGDEYMVVAGWEHFIESGDNGHNTPSTNVIGATSASNASYGDALPDASAGGGGGAHQANSTGNSRMVCSLNSFDASGKGFKAQMNAESIFHFGMLAVQMLDTQFFEGAWCAVRGVTWVEGAGQGLFGSNPSSPVTSEQFQERIPLVVSVDLGRIAGVLLAGTTLSYVAVGDTIKRCIRNMRAATHGGVHLTYDFAHALSIHTEVDSVWCTVVEAPDTDARRNSMQRQSDSLPEEQLNVGISMWTAPVVLASGQPGDFVQHQGQSSNVLALPNNDLEMNRMSPMASATRANFSLSYHNNSNSVQRSHVVTGDEAAQPRNATANVKHRDGSAKIVDKSNDAVLKNILISTRVEQSYFVFFEFTNKQMEKTYQRTTLVRSSSRRDRFLFHFTCSLLHSVTLLLVSLISGVAFSLASAPTGFIVAALLSAVAIGLTYAYYEALEELYMNALEFAFKIVVVSAFVLAMFEVNVFFAGPFPWLIFNLVMSVLPRVGGYYAVDIGRMLMWVVPFVIMTNTRKEVSVANNATTTLLEVVVSGMFIVSRVIDERVRREVFAAAIRLTLLNSELSNDYEAVQALLQRMMPSAAVVQDLMVLLREGKTVMSLYEPRPELENRCKLATPTRQIPFLLLSLVYDGATPIPSRRRAVSVDQMRPILKPMWKFFTFVHDILLKNESVRGVALVKTTGDTLFFAPNEESITKCSTGDTTSCAAEYAEVHLRLASLAALILDAPPGSSISRIERKMVLSSGPLTGAILGTCALSYEYYGAAVYIAQDLMHRTMNQLVGTAGFLANSPHAGVKALFHVGPLQSERVSAFGVENIRPMALRKKQQKDDDRLVTEGAKLRIARPNRCGA